MGNHNMKTILKYLNYIIIDLKFITSRKSCSYSSLDRVCSLDYL